MNQWQGGSRDPKKKMARKLLSLDRECLIKHLPSNVYDLLREIYVHLPFVA